MKQPNTINAGSETNASPTHEAISRRAEELWKKYDCPVGRDEEIWCEAERQLQREGAPASAARNENERPATPRRASGRVGSGGSNPPIQRR